MWRYNVIGTDTKGDFIFRFQKALCWLCPCRKHCVTNVDRSTDVCSCLVFYNVSYMFTEINKSYHVHKYMRLHKQQNSSTIILKIESQIFLDHVKFYSNLFFLMSVRFIPEDDSRVFILITIICFYMLH